MANLKAAPFNPRKISDTVLAGLSASMTEFGDISGIVWNKRNGYLVAGHQRMKAMSNPVMEPRTYAGADTQFYVVDGEKEFPVRVVDWPDDKHKAAMIEANNPHIAGDWDLPELYKMIDEVAASCDLDVLRIDLLDDRKLEPLVEDAIEQPPPRSKVGDLWQCGEHRVLCGDARLSVDVDRVLQGLGVDACVTDPPYGIGFGYVSHDDSRRKWFPLMNRVVPIVRSMSPLVIMPCCGIDRLGWWYANHKPDWLMAWYKGSPGHRSHVGFNDWEAHLVWGKPANPMHDYFQTECGFDKSLDHSCPKPVAWAEWLCERAAPKGGVILDPFLGSGTTLIACERLKRKCYGMEIEPKYVDIILARWESFTGQTATNIGA